MPEIIKTKVPLAPLTTLGVGGSAEYFATVRSRDELREVVAWALAHEHPVTILGSGSNVLITDQGVVGVVLRVVLTGITYEKTNSEVVRVIAEAGVILDELIEKVVQDGLWGIENLSSIPGTVGATPLQNVGAYGVEISDLIETVEVFNMESQTIEILTKDECYFGYRDSVFKRPEGKKYIILSVTLLLHTHPSAHIEYKDLALFFEDNTSPEIHEIRSAIISIRKKKFPDWHTIGTAGSFFKNPIISQEEFIRIKKQYPNLPGYEESDGRVKISLGWVLDKVCNLRGYAEGDVSLYSEQALVLVCKKGIDASTIENFSEKIIKRVFEELKIIIEREVTILK